MLNRRTLRIKAFKSLYALENLKQANMNLAREQVEQAFAPDLNSMTPQDPELLDAEKEKALIQFDDLKCGYDAGADWPASAGIEKVVEDALDVMGADDQKDQAQLEKALFKDIESIRLGQFFIFQLLDDLGFQNKKLVDEREELDRVLKHPGKSGFNLYNNRVLKKITSNPIYKDAIRQKAIFRINDPDLLRDWYKGILSKNEVFKEYIGKKDVDYQDDWNMVDYLVRQVIFTNEEIGDYLSEQDINWLDNRPVIKSLVLKTIKTVKEEESEIEFAEFSYNWEDDSEFLRKLYRKTAEDSTYLEEIVKNKLENWDINRIALTDKVILKTAISEMINFPSIPVKVSINEYIEMSKIYSTPKSRKFINGILDVISDKLLNEKIVRKSGRGLIDNK